MSIENGNESGAGEQQPAYGPRSGGDRPRRDGGGSGGGDDGRRGGGGGGGGRGKPFFVKKRCKFCEFQDLPIDYKDEKSLQRYISPRGKIHPRRFTGTCAKHQRKIAAEIKKARFMALLPYTDHQ